MTISIQYINTGTSANKGNGDTLRQAFMKINSNFNVVSQSTLFDGQYSSLQGVPQNLTSTGSVTFNDLTLVGNTIVLSKNSTSANQAEGAGIYVNGPATTATMIYASETDSWDSNKTLRVPKLFVNGIPVEGSSLGDIAVSENIITTLNTDQDIVLNPTGLGRVNLASSSLQFDNGNGVIWRGHLLYTAPNTGLVGLGIDDNNASLRIAGDPTTAGTLVDFGVYDNTEGTWTSKVLIDTDGVLYAGNQYPITKYTYTSIRSTGDSPVYFATMIGQNINSGETASTDFVLYNDQGTDSTNFLDIGINSSNYNAPQFSVNGAGDSYIFAANNNLTIGTAEPDSTLIFHAGGTTINDAGGRLDQNGWMLSRKVEVVVDSLSPLRFKVQNTSNTADSQSIFEAANDVGKTLQMGINSSNPNAAYGNIGPNEMFIHGHDSTSTIHIGSNGDLIFYADQTFGYQGTPTVLISKVDQSVRLTGDLVFADNTRQTTAFTGVYTATTASDWEGTPPATINEAIDRLAAEDLKISQLSTATLPLTGTELIPVVQEGVNKISTPDQIVSSVLSASKPINISIVGSVTSDEIVTDRIRTSTGETPTITSDGNLNFAVAGRIDISSGSLTLGRFDNTTRDTIPAVNGTIIYNTTDNTIQAYANGDWLAISTPQTNSVTITTTSTLAPNSDIATQYNITSLSSDLSVLAPTGNSKDGQKLIIRIYSNSSVNRNITWNSVYRPIGVSLPAATAISKTTYVGFLYNQEASTWDAVAVKTQV